MVFRGFPDGSVVKKLPAMQETQETQVLSLGWEDLLEEEVAAHSGILVCRIPRTEEPGHDRAPEPMFIHITQRYFFKLL